MSIAEPEVLKSSTNSSGVIGRAITISIEIVDPVRVNKEFIDDDAAA